MSITRLTERIGRVIGKTPTSGSNIWSLSSLLKYRPLATSGLQLWLDASDASTLYDATTGGALVAADGGVARWEDKSGNGRHFTQPTAGSRPARKTAIQSGKDVLRFDGSADFLERTGTLIGTGAAPVTVFAVVAFDTFSGSPEIIEIGNKPRSAPENTSGYQFIVLNGAQMYCSNIGGNNERYTANNTLSATTWYALSYVVSGAAFSATEPKFFKNGSSQASTQGTGTSTPNVTASQNAAIGANLSSLRAQYLDGDIGELIIYNVALNDSDREAVENYLMAKWGIT
jgi:hypothetical protein